MFTFASDWDETITSVDTLAIVAPPSKASLFAELSDAYVADLAAAPPAPPPEGGLDALLAHLASLDAVELRSQARVEASGLFKGAKQDALDERAARVAFRPGWDAVAAWIEARRVDFHVISVGWRARLIAHALALPEGGRVAPASITANEVEMALVDGEWTGTGRLTKSRSEPAGRSGVRVARDKRHALEPLLPARGIAVYAGDSLTDIEALLRVDVGLLLGPATKLKSTLEALFPGCVYTSAGWKDAGAPLSGCTDWAFWSKKTGAQPHPVKVFVHTPTWHDALPVLEQLWTMQ